MANQIFVKAKNGATLSSMFDEPLIGIKYYDIAHDHKAPSDGTTLYTVEIRGHEDVLTDGRTYSVQGFLKKLNFEFELSSRPSIKYEIYNNGKLAGTIDRKVSLDDILDTALAILDTSRLFTPNSYVAFYRKVNDKKYKFCGSLAPEGITFDEYIKNNRL